MIVSICFTWFLIGSLGKFNLYHQSNIYHQLDFYTRTANFTWGVSDCEELVGHLIEHLAISGLSLV